MIESHVSTFGQLHLFILVYKREHTQEIEIRNYSQYVLLRCLRFKLCPMKFPLFY